MKIEIIPADKKFEPLLDLYKPLPANKFLPEWYKKMGRGELLDSELADTAEEMLLLKNVLLYKICLLKDLYYPCGETSFLNLFMMKKEI